ncbi:craniofacial development protein 2-like [Plakobranchus ocellatus]|uniref:Craniofacial development protein 2-like n=1 Tax=Plakobranchus ocellatus TaxID=259542 RepID=A0AAV4AA19_9GAST|nr:craniofacial development protein 2-like [Plakobranchus ocellatus]
MGAWNVLTMLQKGTLENIKQEMEKKNLNILGLSEVKWRGAGCMTFDNYIILYSVGGQHQKAVGMILVEETSKAIKGFWTVNDRVLIVKLKCAPFDSGIVQIMHQQLKKKMTQRLEEFYEHIEKAMKQLKSQDIRIIMGDFNSKIGKGKYENTVGV